MNMLIVVLTLLVSFIGALGAVYLKKASSKFRLSFEGILKNFNLYVGGFFYLISTVVFVYLLKFEEVSILYPALATSYIWVSLLSTAMLKEKMSTKKWTGIILIIIGVIFLF